MKSLAQKVEQCSGLLGTRDVSAWETDFLSSINERVARDGSTLSLSDKQAEIVDRIWRKHFA